MHLLMLITTWEAVTGKGWRFALNTHPIHHEFKNQYYPRVFQNLKGLVVYILLPALTKPNYMGHIWTNYGIDMVQPMGHIWEVYGFGMAWLPS